MRSTQFILTKEGRELKTTSLFFVKKLKTLGWKVKHNELSLYI